MARVVREVELVIYQGRNLSRHPKLSALLETCGPAQGRLWRGGRALFAAQTSARRGQMPGCHVTDVVVRLWNALEAGDRAEPGGCMPRWRRSLLEQQWPGGAYKDVLVLRGVIPSARSRSAGAAPDAEDYRALREVMQGLAPLLTWHA